MSENEQPWIMETQGGRTVEVSRKPEGALMRIRSTYHVMTLSLDAEELISLRDRLSEILGDGPIRSAAQEAARMFVNGTPFPEIVKVLDAAGPPAMAATDAGESLKESLRQIGDDAAYIFKDGIRPEELAYLLASKRCDECGHLSALHDVETIRCELCPCRTDGLNV